MDDCILIHPATYYQETYEKVQKSSSESPKAKEVCNGGVACRDGG